MLFDDLGVAPEPKNPEEVAKRLLRRFVSHAASEPVPEAALQKFERLILLRLEKQVPFAEAMLTGYQAFLCRVISVSARPYWPTIILPSPHDFHF
jgi:hypothetical protein